MKKIMYLCVIMGATFWSLYFLGDFKIGDVHVKSFMQKTFTIENLRHTKRMAEQSYKILSELYDSKDKLGVLTGESAGTLDLEQLNGLDLKQLEQLEKVPVQSVSTQDRDQLMKILQQNLKHLEDFPKQIEMMQNNSKSKK